MTLGVGTPTELRVGVTGDDGALDPGTTTTGVGATDELMLDGVAGAAASPLQATTPSSTATDASATVSLLVIGGALRVGKQSEHDNQHIRPEDNESSNCGQVRSQVTGSMAISSPSRAPRSRWSLSPLQNFPGSYQFCGRLSASRPMAW
jgi:hypothetical protein